MKIQEKSLPGASTSRYPFPPRWKSVYLKSHFAPAFFFLAPHRRKALKLLYTVCRVLDDAVDNLKGDPKPLLDAWKIVFSEKKPEAVESFYQTSLAADFLQAAIRFDIPLFAMVDLIEKGVEVDTKVNRFQTPMDLESYCYGVAGTVGLCCLPIFGVPYIEAKEFAIRLGITVQWINSLRDVGTDAKRNRIYLPLDHLDQFEYTEDLLFKGVQNQDFISLMRLECSIARAHYKRAIELLPPRWEKELLPARIMGRIYMRLLDKIEHENYPVLEKKVKLNLGEKLMATWKTLKDKKF